MNIYRFMVLATYLEEREGKSRDSGVDDILTAIVLKCTKKEVPTFHALTASYV